MNKEEKLLINLVEALDYMGLSWFHSFEDDLVMRLARNEITAAIKDELTKLMTEIRNELCPSGHWRYKIETALLSVNSSMIAD